MTVPGGEDDWFAAIVCFHRFHQSGGFVVFGDGVEEECLVQAKVALQPGRSLDSCVEEFSCERSQPFLAIGTAPLRPGNVACNESQEVETDGGQRGVVAARFHADACQGGDLRVGTAPARQQPPDGLAIGIYVIGTVLDDLQKLGNVVSAEVLEDAQIGARPVWMECNRHSGLLQRTLLFDFPDVPACLRDGVSVAASASFPGSSPGVAGACDM